MGTVGLTYPAAATLQANISADIEPKEEVVVGMSAKKRREIEYSRKVGGRK
jgi:hypothetical protein